MNELQYREAILRILRTFGDEGLLFWQLRRWLELDDPDVRPKETQRQLHVMMEHGMVDRHADGRYCAVAELTGPPENGRGGEGLMV